MKTDLYNQEGKVVGEVDLPDRLFGRPMERDLVYQVARILAANRRRRVAHAKGRGEVRGGGRKPWPQKGTGRARHGSIRSPLWKGGGVAHGPKKERQFKLKISQKMNQAAIASLLSEKARRNEVRVLEEFKPVQPKTKAAKAILDKFLGTGKKMETAVVLLPESGKEVMRSTRNLRNVKVMSAQNLNVLELLGRRMLIIARDAVPVLENTFKYVH